MLATPCATSSTFGLWRSPLIRSATTADSSDSIAPSIATVRAGDEQREDQVRPELRHVQRRQARSGCRRSAMPIVSTGSADAATRRPCRASSATM